MSGIRWGVSPAAQIGCFLAVSSAPEVVASNYLGSGARGLGQDKGLEASLNDICIAPRLAISGAQKH